MLTETQLKQIVRAVHGEKDLYGCIIGFHGNNQSRVLHEGFMVAVAYSKVVVIIEETSQSSVNLKELELPVEPESPEVVPEILTNKSRLTSELIGAGASCGLTVLSGVGIVAGAAAEIPSGGTSTALIILGWTGLVTSGAQCINGIVRSAEAITNPETNSLEQWDNNKIYSTAFLIVDGFGVVSSVISLPLATRNLLAVLERRGGMIAASELQALSKAERAAAIQKALKEATRSPEGRKAVEKALKEAGLSEKQIAQAMARGANTVRRSTLVTRAISQDTATRLFRNVRDIAGGVAGVGLSGTPQKWTGSGSGSVNAVIMHFVEKK